MTKIADLEQAVSLAHRLNSARAVQAALGADKQEHLYRLRAESRFVNKAKETILALDDDLDLVRTLVDGYAASLERQLTALEVVV